MSRRGNCHENTVAECFFQLLKRERVKRKIYATRDEVRSDIFHYIRLKTGWVPEIRFSVIWPHLLDHYQFTSLLMVCNDDVILPTLLTG